MWRESTPAPVSGKSGLFPTVGDVSDLPLRADRQRLSTIGVSRLRSMLHRRGRSERNLKDLLTNATVAAFSPLPSRIKRALAFSLVRSMADADRYVLASQIASEVNISRFAVRGTQGIFESLSTDLAILQSYALGGSWAAPMLKLAANTLCGTDGTYIDIGANIGLTLVPIASEGFRCYAFEPEPENFESLMRNVARNCGSGNTVLMQLALSDVAGEARFSLARGNLGDHRIVGADVNKPGRLPVDRRSETMVKTETLDGVALPIVDPLVVKIDAQGAEPLIIRGGRKTLSRAKLLIMEFSPFHMAKFQCNIDDVLGFLDNHFAVLSFGVGEGRDFEPCVSKAEAILELRKYFFENKENPDNYLDVAAAN
jgi:FkbM family methyltransferase